jgi:hypothetical protein
MDLEEREDACTIEDYLSLTPPMSIFVMGNYYGGRACG